jgi:plasmid stabilization system protein ParE
LIPIELLPGARAELVLASEWFEDQENGLGAQFLASAGHTIDAIQAHPERFARVNAPRRVRRAILKRFPYAVYYTFNGSRIFILSLFHLRRDPASLNERLHLALINLKP